MHLQHQHQAASRKFVAALPLRRSSRSASSACGVDDDSTSSERAASSGSVSGDVSLVAYSTPQEVYEEGLGPDFQAGDGSEVELAYSFGSSGDQSRAVEAGAPADVVHLALEPDMTRLVDVGAVAEDWAEQRDGGRSADLGGRVHGPRRQPQGHHGMGRPHSR